jgi:endonuclease I
MQKNITLLTALLIVFKLSAQTPVSITNLTTPYTENFNTLASSGTANSILPAGWQFLETGSGANTTYIADDGTSPSGNTFSFGSSASTERAFGGLQSGSVVPTVGVAFTNNSGSAITSMAIAYRGEQWRLGATGRLDSLRFQYSLDASSLGTGTWTQVKDLSFQAPIQSGTIGPISGNNTGNFVPLSFTITGLNIPNGATFYLRWNDFNATGADDGLGIDDLSINFSGVTLPACVAPTILPTNLVVNGATLNSLTANFTAGTADGYLVAVSTSNTMTPPSDGVAYSEGQVINGATIINIGTETTIPASGLNPATTYYFYVYAFNNTNCSGGPAFAAAITGNGTTSTPPTCAVPSGLVSGLSYTATSTTISGSFAAATGADGYLVCRTTSNNLGFTPSAGTSYAVGQNVGNGVVVKFGTGANFLATGLMANTMYNFYIFSVSNFTCTGGPLYNINAVQSNFATNNNNSNQPANYYNTTAGLSCATLKTELKNIISAGMQPQSYGALYSQYAISDVKPSELRSGSPNVIWDIYSDNPTGLDPYDFLTSNNCGNYSNEGDCYNREHSVPQSWFTGGTATGPGTDYHHIFPTDGKVNGIRSSYIYGEVSNPSSPTPTLNGSKLGPSATAGLTGTVFEPINEYKGDLARAFLYFVTRYENNMTGWSGGANGGQAMDPTTFPSVDIDYLRLMLRWHAQDPVSQKEIDRNNGGYTFQANRNPYVDSPQFVNRVWNATCPGLSALPVDWIYFAGKLNGNQLQLKWNVANERNVASYVVERSSNGISFVPVAGIAANGGTSYTHIDNVEQLTGRRLYYRIKQIDKDGQFSYSKIFSIHIPLNVKFVVAPNPVQQVLRLQASGLLTGTVQVLITDMSGRVLQQSSQPATNTINLNVSVLLPGSYVVRLVADGTAYWQRFEKI